MAKRLLALVLCFLVLIGFTRPVVQAAAEEEDTQTTQSEEMMDLCKRTYRKALYNTGRSSLSGMCGLMAGYYLWLLDATKSPEVYNGNDYFDNYATKLYTSMGNKVRTYSAEDYTLAEAMYTASCGGSRDVYNLIACFQWTNTEAGNRFGHAVVVHAILDGKVYFTEGFRTSLGGAAGNAIVCSIREFEDFYGDWTRFEGLVVLGRRDYTDYCTFYGTDLFISADEAQVLSQPSREGSNESTLLRLTVRNETLRTTGIMKNDRGELYYRILDSNGAAYIPVSEATISRVNNEGVTVDAQITAAQENQPWQLEGGLYTDGSILHSVTAVITDAEGALLEKTKWSVGSRMFDFDQLNQLISSRCLPGNTYNIELLASVENNVPSGKQIYLQRRNICVWRSQLQVSEAAAACVAVSEAKAEYADGWHWDGQTRYYYQDGKPRTGWFCENGVDYYFQADGAVTTGWAEINGHYRYFTETGVMRTGWLETEQGTHYLRSNGAAVTGFIRLGGKLYYFNEDRVLLKRCTVMIDEELYVIDANGIVLEV